MPIRLDETADRRELREAAECRLRDAAFVDVPTAALALGVAQRIIRDAIDRGEIRAVRVGRSIRIPAAPLRLAWGIE